MFKFRRRKSDVERYERAKKVLSLVTFDVAKKDLQKEIDGYETRSKIISYFVNHPNLQTIKSDKVKSGEYYTLDIKLIARNEDKYYVKDAKMHCQLIGENYVEQWRNVGADYHSINIPTGTGKLNYWFHQYDDFLLEQLLNQDKLEDMCKELNIMSKNYFDI